jgi:hypothetical protein
VTGEPPTGKLETRSKELFENSLEQLDARTRSRLTQARHAALDELKRTRGVHARWIWAPAGGVAAAAAITVFLIGRPDIDPATSGAPALEDLEAVAAVENIELLEDVEFYAWLAEQARSTPDANSG